jgi:hypothetical protein
MINLTKFYIIGFLLLCSAKSNAANVTGIVTNTSIANCNGGSIDLSVNGGVMPYTYFWKSTVTGFTATTQDIQNLATGQYCVTVTDAICGTAVTCYNIIQTETGKLVFVSSTKNVTNCNGEYPGSDGSITLSTIGTPNCTYKWTGPNAFSSTNQNLSNLAMGTYNLTVTYPNGCKQTEKVVLCCCKPNTVPSNNTTNYCMGNVTTDPIFLNFQSVVKPTFSTSNNGKIFLSVNGGLFGGFNNYYNWTGPNGYKAYTRDIGNLIPGEYCVIVTDGCKSVSQCFNLQSCENTTLTATTTVACPDFPAGSIIPKITNGIEPYKFTWSNGSNANQLTGLTSGTYLVTVTDLGGCTLTNSYLIGAAVMEIVNESQPCQTCMLCGPTRKCEAKEVINNYSKCNRINAVCTATNTEIPGELYQLFLIDGTNCTIPCPDGTKITGTMVTDAGAVIDPNNSLKCGTGAACIFKDIEYDGKNHPFIAVNSAGGIIEYKYDVVTVKEGSDACTGDTKCVVATYCVNKTNPAMEERTAILAIIKNSNVKANSIVIL